MPHPDARRGRHSHLPHPNAGLAIYIELGPDVRTLRKVAEHFAAQSHKVAYNTLLAWSARYK